MVIKNGHILFLSQRMKFFVLKIAMQVNLISRSSYKLSCAKKVIKVKEYVNIL